MLKELNFIQCTNRKAKNRLRRRRVDTFVRFLLVHVSMHSFYSHKCTLTVPLGLLFIVCCELRQTQVALDAYNEQRPLTSGEVARI